MKHTGVKIPVKAAVGTSRRAGRKAMSQKAKSRPTRSRQSNNFYRDHFVEIVIVGLIIFFSAVATHLLWLMMGHPDTPLLEKGFEMFSEAVTSLVGALIMKLSPGRSRR